MTSVSAVVASLLLASPLLVPAQEPPLPPGGVVPAPARPSPYARAAPARPTPVSLGVRLGMYDPSGDDMALFDEGVDLEAAIAAQLHPNVALEGAVGYYRSATDRVTFFDPLLGTISVKGALRVIPITVSVRAGARVERLSFYGIFGLGLHMASLEEDIDAPGLIAGTGSYDDNAVGVHLGAGVGVQVSPAASIGVELRRTFVDATFGDEEYGIGGLRLGATLAFRL
jgi:opacity protein-like surface antigen